MQGDKEVLSAINTSNTWENLEAWWPCMEVHIEAEVFNERNIVCAKILM